MLIKYIDKVRIIQMNEKENKWVNIKDWNFIDKIKWSCPICGTINYRKICKICGHNKNNGYVTTNS